MSVSGIPIVKAHAYGNDFLYVRQDDLGSIDPVTLARAVCERHTGIGADGLIVVGARGGVTTMRLINSDGSPAEVSGNGVRGLAAVLIRSGAADGPDVTIQTDAGEKTLTLLGQSNGRYLFRAAMGRPEDIRRVTLQVGSEAIAATTLWIGNPQCVVLGPLPDASRFHTLGPQLERHTAFPAGTNVEFAEPRRRDEVHIVIWERGAGPTRSSGTGSCAAAVAAVEAGVCDRVLTVVAPGGSQQVDWRDEGVYLTGWAEVVLEGTWVAHLG